MGLDPEALTKRMELLTAYQLAIENYSASIQALERARGTSEYDNLSRAARDVHTQCDKAREAVANHRLNSDGNGVGQGPDAPKDS